MEEAKLTANKEAKRIIIQTIQRVSTEHAIENAVTVFTIENEEVKGRIIGREGRNIRALEAATGVEIIVDDTPESIILSCFDPVRRELARLALHQLVSDGRIHPARIHRLPRGRCTARTTPITFTDSASGALTFPSTRSLGTLRLSVPRNVVSYVPLLLSRC